MFDAFFQRMRTRSAARKFARQLGPRLQADYGAGSHYTPAQIEASARRAKLPVAEIRFGFAGFLSEAEFAKAATGDYHALRALLEKYAPRRAPTAGFGQVPEQQVSLGDPPFS